MTAPFPFLSLLVVPLFAIVTGTSNAQDQSRIRLGITFGGSADFYQMKGLGPMENPYHLRFFPYGSSISHSGRIGATADYRLSPVWGLTAHVDYATGSADFAQTITDREAFELEVVSNGTPSGDTIDPHDLVLGYEYAARVDYNRVEYALMVSRELLGDSSTFSIGAAFGPVMSRIYQLREQKSVEILQERSTDVIVRFAPPENPRLAQENLGTRLVDESLNQRGTMDWHLGLRGGLFARIGSFRKHGTAVVPGIYFDYGLRQLLPAPSNLTLNALIARVDVTVGL